MPPGMSGDRGLIRVGPGGVGEEQHTCPAFAAAKARPAMQPLKYTPKVKPALEDFTLQPVTAALDAIEFHGMPVDVALALPFDGRPLHAGHAQYARHAIVAYLA